MNKHMKVIIMQSVFLIGVLIAIYFLYPKMNVDVNGDRVRFNSINAHVVMISENPDFSNPRYIDMNEIENVSFGLNPGTYYYKASNGFISGFKKEFTIGSEVGMNLKKEGNETGLVNVGNVKINVTKKGGVMVGHIILEPEQEEKIEDSGQYIGRQA
jgi:hypothetical protein